MSMCYSDPLYALSDALYMKLELNSNEETFTGEMGVKVKNTPLRLKLAVLCARYSQRDSQKSRAVALIQVRGKLCLLAIFTTRKQVMMVVNMAQVNPSEVDALKADPEALARTYVKTVLPGVVEVFSRVGVKGKWQQWPTWQEDMGLDDTPLDQRKTGTN